MVDELRCKVVGRRHRPTQLGRIEYARGGGQVLTGRSSTTWPASIVPTIKSTSRDSAGTRYRQRRHDREATQPVATDMTDEGRELVLRQNYLQPQAINHLCGGGGRSGDHLGHAFAGSVDFTRPGIPARRREEL